MNARPAAMNERAYTCSASGKISIACVQAALARPSQHGVQWTLVSYEQMAHRARGNLAELAVHVQVELLAQRVVPICPHRVSAEYLAHDLALGVRI